MIIFKINLNNANSIFKYKHLPLFLYPNYKPQYPHPAKKTG